MRALVAALRFLTRIPVPGPATVARDLPRATVWFPLVGAGVGLLIGLAATLLTGLWPALVAAILAVAFGLLLTGAFHEDAVADSADALGGATDRASLERILADSRVGTYGACALWLLLALRSAAIVHLGPTAPAALALAMAWGRWTAAPLLLSLPSLHAGLGFDIGRTLRWWHPLLATLLALLVSAAAWPWLASDVFLGGGAALALALLWWAYLRQRVGAQNGDLLGAGNQLVEAGVLLVCLAGSGP